MINVWELTNAYQMQIDDLIYQHSAIWACSAATKLEAWSTLTQTYGELL